MTVQIDDSFLNTSTNGAFAMLVGMVEGIKDFGTFVIISRRAMITTVDGHEIAR
jgi:hypothetical protein